MGICFSSHVEEVYQPPDNMSASPDHHPRARPPSITSTTKPPSYAASNGGLSYASHGGLSYHTNRYPPVPHYPGTPGKDKPEISMIKPPYSPRSGGHDKSDSTAPGYVERDEGKGDKWAPIPTRSKQVTPPPPPQRTATTTGRSQTTSPPISPFPTNPIIRPIIPASPVQTHTRSTSQAAPSRNLSDAASSCPGAGGGRRWVGEGSYDTRYQADSAGVGVSTDPAYRHGSGSGSNAVEELPSLSGEESREKGEGSMEPRNYQTRMLRRDVWNQRMQATQRAAAGGGGE